MLIRWGTDPDRADQTGWSAMVPSQKPVPPSLPSLRPGMRTAPTFEPRGPSGLPPPWRKSPGDLECRYQGDCDGMGDAETDAIARLHSPNVILSLSSPCLCEYPQRNGAKRGEKHLPRCGACTSYRSPPILITPRFVWALKTWGGRQNPGSSADPAPNKQRPAANPNAQPTRGRSPPQSPWRPLRKPSATGIFARQAPPPPATTNFAPSGNHNLCPIWRC